MNASIAAGVALAELCDRGLGAAFAGQQIAAVGGGQEILRAALDDAQAVIGELQIGDDLRIEQADGVGRDRIAEAGMEFLGHGGAADHLAALDHFHAQAGHREIGRAGEAVMARADDDNVGFVHGPLQELRDRFAAGMSAATRPVIRVDVRMPGICSAAMIAAHCAPLRRRLCATAVGMPAAGARRVQAGVFMTSPDAVRRRGPAVRLPEPAGPDRLHRRDLRQRAAAVLGAAAVHQDGAAAARRLAGGVVGGDGVLPVAAARRLCLCALS